MKETLTNGATITIESTGEKYHTLKDWGLAIGNNNYIKEPVLEEHLVDVPGRSGQIDMTEAIAGRPVFKSREISIQLGGLRGRNSWDTYMSLFRNKIQGRVIKVTFDNDKGYYWIGRASVQDFDRARELGTFTIDLPCADAYKYSIINSTEPWLWNPFSFVTGIIDNGTQFQVEGTAKYTLYAGYMPIIPVFLVSNVGTGSLIMHANNKNYTLKDGRNRFPDLVVDQENTVMDFNGNGNVTVLFRRGSL